MTPRQYVAMAACFALVGFVPFAVPFDTPAAAHSMIKLVLTLSICVLAVGALAWAINSRLAMAREKLRQAINAFDDLDDEALLSLENTRRASVMSEGTHDGVPGHLPPSHFELHRPDRVRSSEVCQ